MGRTRSMAHELPKIAATAVLDAFVAGFILRDPVGARLGAAAPMGAILASWLLGPLVPARGGRNYGRALVITLGGMALLVSAVMLTGGSPARALKVSQTTSVGMADCASSQRIHRTRRCCQIPRASSPTSGRVRRPAAECSWTALFHRCTSSRSVDLREACRSSLADTGRAFRTRIGRSSGCGMNSSR